MRPFWPRVIAPFLLRESHGGQRLTKGKRELCCPKYVPTNIKIEIDLKISYLLYGNVRFSSLLGNLFFSSNSRGPPWDERRRKGAITLGQKGRNLALNVPNYVPFEGLAALWHIMPTFSEPGLTPCCLSFVAKPNQERT